MDKILFYIGIAILGGLILFSLSASVAGAFNPFDISYPIAELGNCNSQGECKTFCDDAANQAACFDWAAKQGLVSEKEVKKAQTVRRMEERTNDPNYNGEGVPVEDYGPGGCKDPKECDNFCRKLENLDVCLDYSVEKGFMPKDEAEKIKAKTRQGGPGGCKDPKECDNFCRKPENMKQCMQFVVDEGKISREEADFMIERAEKFGPSGPEGQGPKRRGPDAGPKIDKEKAKKILEEKGGPGGCKTMDECENFCGNPDNMETCINFAAEQGMMVPAEIEKAKKIMNVGGPGGCRGPQECDAFCGQEGNGEICMKFAIDNGMMPPEEIGEMKKEMEIVKKLQNKGGPGGCRGPEECGRYCGDQAHLDECMNFASQNRMMPKEEIEQRKNEMRIMQEKVNMTEEGQMRFMRQEFPGRGMGMPPERPQGFEGRTPVFEQPQGEPGERFQDFNRQGPNPSENGFEQGNFDPGRMDFQKFGDFDNMETGQYKQMPYQQIPAERPAEFNFQQPPMNMEQNFAPMQFMQPTQPMQQMMPVPQIDTQTPPPLPNQPAPSSLIRSSFGAVIATLLNFLGHTPK